MHHRLSSQTVQEIRVHKATREEQHAACRLLKKCSHQITSPDVMLMAARVLAVLGPDDEHLAAEKESQRADNLWLISHKLVEETQQR